MSDNLIDVFVRYQREAITNMSMIRKKASFDLIELCIHRFIILLIMDIWKNICLKNTSISFLYIRI